MRNKSIEIIKTEKTTKLLSTCLKENHNLNYIS